MSSVSTIPLFGRAYSLKLNNGQQTLEVTNGSWEPEALRITFETEAVYRSLAFWAEIKIYNLNTQTQQAVLNSITSTPPNQTGTQPIQQGDEVTLSAGYQAGSNYGVIFDGNVFQPTWEKIDVVDYVITLRCYLGLGPFSGQLVSSNYQGGIDQLSVVKRMAAAAGITYKGEQVSEDALAAITLPRGGVIFGPPTKYLQQIAAQNQMLFCPMSDGSFVMKTITDVLAITGTPQFTYSPPLPPDLNLQPQQGIDYTIIGTPQQTEQGVVFRVLMDPRLKVQWPPLIVKIDNTVVRQLAIQVGQTLIAPLAADGTYVVIGVRHIGDTRGNDWYTEVTAVTPKGIATAFGVATAKASGG